MCLKVILTLHNIIHLSVEGGTGNNLDTIEEPYHGYSLTNAAI